MIFELAGFDAGVFAVLKHHPRGLRSGAQKSWVPILAGERRIPGHDVNALSHPIGGNVDDGPHQAGQQAAAERSLRTPPRIVGYVPHQHAVAQRYLLEQILHVRQAKHPQHVLERVRIFPMQISAARHRQLGVRQSCLRHVVKRLEPAERQRQR